MIFQSTSKLRLLVASVLGSSALWVNALEPTRIVFQNGRGVPISSVSLQGDSLVITAANEYFTEGQKLELISADHVYGDKPPEINRGTALTLMGKSSEAIAVLEPIIAQHRITAKIPGNFWVEAARALLVSYAQTGNVAKTDEIGKEISEATPVQGIDPFVTLGKALLLPSSTKAAELEVAFRDLTTDNLPAAVCAYASFFRGNTLKAAKRDAEALETYLRVPCLFPSGGMILNAAAEYHAAEYLIAIDRREERLALLNSSILGADNTIIAVEANKRLESSK